MIEAERKQLIKRPFTVRDRDGSLLTAVAIGYGMTYPGVHVGDMDGPGVDCDLTWYGLKAAIERGVVVNILYWMRNYSELPDV